MLFNPISLFKPTLFITNEDPDILTAVFYLLEQKGFIVITHVVDEESATSDEKPLKKDYNLVGTDGLNLLRHVSRFWSQKSPVVVLIRR